MVYLLLNSTRKFVVIGGKFKKYSEMVRKILCLFDVDGTLTKPRGMISEETDKFIQEKIKPLSKIALVGGSDFGKIAEQMHGNDVVNKYDYVFAENGLIYYKNGQEICRQSIQKHMGEDTLQSFLNFALKTLSEVTLPVKRGTFIEFRTGMLNISPIGRSCSQKEREDFEKYDLEHGIRNSMIEKLKIQFPDIGFTYSIGGQISFDVFPHGWDKTFCLQHLEQECFDEIHFFGDRTDKGGNDYEIFNDPRTIGHKVCNPADTVNQLKTLFNIS